MRTASPKIMLERLTEEWTDPTDTTINEELEFEKKLWMRTALHAMTEEASGSSGGASKPATASSDAVKILSLYEDYGMPIFHAHSHGSSIPSSFLFHQTHLNPKFLALLRTPSPNALPSTMLTPFPS
jgi:hypothetical protein